MKIKNILSITIPIIFIFLNNAYACDLKQIPFGQNLTEIIKYYKINSSVNAHIEQLKSLHNGSFKLRGRDFCQKLSLSNIAEMIINDDKLKQIKIKKINSIEPNSLYKLAVETFGKQNNRSNLSQNDPDHFRIYWIADNKLVTYITYLQGKEEFELLDITDDYKNSPYIEKNNSE